MYSPNSLVLEYFQMRMVYVCWWQLMVERDSVQYLHLPGTGMNMELQFNFEVGSMETFVYGLRSNQKRVEELLTCNEPASTAFPSALRNRPHQCRHGLLNKNKNVERKQLTIWSGFTFGQCFNGAINFELINISPGRKYFRAIHKIAFRFIF